MTETVHTATEVAHVAEAAGGIGALGVNLKLLLAQLVNFAVLLVVMWKWVYTPLMRKMDERAERIKDGLDFAHQATKQLEDLGAERDRIVREAKAEAHALIEDAALKAEYVRKTKAAETAADIEKMLADAKARMALEREATFEALRDDVTRLVTLATRKVAEDVGDAERSRLVAKAIEDVGNA